MNTIELLKEIEDFKNAEIVHLYIIERRRKPDSTNKSKPSEKFDYIPLQISLNPELKIIVSSMFAQVIQKKIVIDSNIREYQVIDDSEETIYTYVDLDRISGFNEFLKNKLGSDIKALETFEELEDLEKAWALCYGFYINNEWMYCIKKLPPNKIAVETNISSSIPEALKNGMTSIFDFNTKTLKPFDGFTLNIEPSIDLIYYKEQLYIFRKKAFEDLTSLTDEFVNMANEIVTEINSLEFIDNLEFFTKIINEKPSIRKRIIKAKEIGNIRFLQNCKDLKKEFVRTGKRLNIKFEFDKNGKIKANDEIGADNLIKVLCEYYKEGVFAGKIFESPAGRLKDQ